MSCQEGHSYCRNCIMDWLQKHARCPLGCELTASSLTKNRTADAFIQRRTIRCSIDRCKWVGLLSEQAQHERDTCTFRKIRCNYDGCDELVERRSLAQHQEICGHREIRCPNPGCRLLKPAREMPEHVKECAHDFMICQRECHIERCMNLKLLTAAVLENGKLQSKLAQVELEREELKREISRLQPVPSSPAASSLMCLRCGRKGHSEQTCYAKHHVIGVMIRTPQKEASTRK